jgi:chromate reductase
MKNILAFGASSSKNSINKQLAQYAASQVQDTVVCLIDLNDFEMPIFSVGIENSNGIPNKAQEFKELVDKADGIVLSLAEHNSSFTVAYKNIFDWVSRIDKNVFQSKPLFLLATSPGERGGKSVLDHAVSIYSHSNKSIPQFFSLPSFNKNFDEEKGIIDASLKSEFEKQLESFSEDLKETVGEPCN